MIRTFASTILVSDNKLDLICEGSTTKNSDNASDKIEDNAVLGEVNQDIDELGDADDDGDDDFHKDDMNEDEYAVASADSSPDAGSEPRPSST